MRKTLFFILMMIAVLVSNHLSAKTFPNYYERNLFLMSSAGSFQSGLVGYANPANLKMLHRFESRFYWNTDGTDALSFRDWGWFTGTNLLGFGALQQKFGQEKVTDYKISLSFGDRGIAMGLGYGWSNSNQPFLERENFYSLGFLFRPNRYLSAGLVSNISAESEAGEAVIDIGIRPFGSPRLTLFTDAAFPFQEKYDTKWSAGAAFQLLDGIHLIGRYFDDEAFTMGLSLNLGKGGLKTQSHFDSEQQFAQNSYGVRIGGTMPSVFPRNIQKDKKYIPFELIGRVDYHKPLFFGRNVHSFLELLKNIRNAANDPRISLLSFNLSGMRILPEHAWEVREALKEAQNKGKKVLIFIDNVGMTAYHLASVADWVVMDAEGMITLQGYILGQTYLKGTLEKLGLGFDAWRFFKYKSAVEPLSRDSMSPADREQRKDYVDDWYELVRKEVSHSRGLRSEQFDHIIDEKMVFLPDMALEEGLVDTLGRWSAKDEIIKKLMGQQLTAIADEEIWGNTVAPKRWGELPKIAIVYGLGVCAMDEGIRARWLEKVFLRLEDRNEVKAVVFRVDSPGGDGMASDLVAQAMRKCSKEKPVIVSQGQVAGSGGYWISMFGDTIVAGPNTITGSIGVIGGWLYDKGFSDKLGMSSDYVKRGKHADLGFGITLPFIPIQIPSRNLTEDEKKKMKEFMLKFYDEFVKKVADGRNMTVEEVKKIAEGRIYSGEKGKQIGLVDKVSGLLTAIAIAHHEAGFEPEEEVEWIEIPEYKGLFGFDFSFSPIKTEKKTDPVIQFIKMMAEHPGKPLPMLLPGMYPYLKP